MKRLLLIVLFLSTSLVKGQPSCSSTVAAQDVFYPNTTSVETSTTSSIIYLCGPNTVVYDTNTSCRHAYLNAGSTLYHKSACFGGTYFWLKNGSSLIILPGTNSSFSLLLEPTASYTNMSASSVFTIACSAVSFPTLNCATGINEQNKHENFFKVWPNPTSTKINIALIGINNQSADIIITNELGEIVFENKQFSFTNKEIPVDNLKDGVYFIQVKTKDRQQREKFILVR